MNDQRSLYDQLISLDQLAVEHGLYDASDFLRERINRIQEDSLPVISPINGISTEQYMIARYLLGKGWTSPTEIGCALKGKRFHSAWASPKCKALVRRGLIKRNKKGWYKIK